MNPYEHEIKPFRCYDCKTPTIDLTFWEREEDGRTVNTLICRDCLLVKLPPEQHKRVPSRLLLTGADVLYRCSIHATPPYKETP